MRTALAVRHASESARKERVGISNSPGIFLNRLAAAAAVMADKAEIHGPSGFIERNVGSPMTFAAMTFAAVAFA
jgi:hypothetical protein